MTHQQPAPSSPKQKNPMGLAALIVGGVAFLFAVIPILSFLAWLPALAAIVLGIIGLVRKNRPRGQAWTGLGLGVVAWIIAIAVSVTSLFALASLDPGPDAAESSSPATQPTKASPTPTDAATPASPSPTPSAAARDWTAELANIDGVVSATETEPGRLEVQSSVEDPRGSDGSPAAQQAIAICEAAVALGADYVSVLEADGTTFVVYGHPSYGNVCTEV